MRTLTLKQVKELEALEAKEMAEAKTPQERRRIYKRQWIRRHRERWNSHYQPRDGVKVYFSKRTMQRIQSLRKKGMMSSSVVIDLVEIGLDVVDRMRADQAAKSVSGGLN